MTMGEGGAVFMNNPELKVIAESFRDLGTPIVIVHLDVIILVAVALIKNTGIYLMVMIINMCIHILDII